MARTKVRDRITIKELRLRKHWSFRRLAREAGISTETLLRLERGGKVLPVTARKVADALGVSEDDVLELDPNPAQNRNGYPSEITGIDVPDLGDLLNEITPENCHDLVDWGQPVGPEVW